MRFSSNFVADFVHLKLYDLFLASNVNKTDS